MSRQKYTAEEVVDALKATNGMVYVAARKLGVCAKTLYNYAKKYPKVQESIAEERGHFIDICEQRLMGAVERDEAWAIAFALKTLGKDRGYVEKQQLEHSGPDGSMPALNIFVNGSVLTSTPGDSVPKPSE